LSNKILLPQRKEEKEKESVQDGKRKDKELSGVIRRRTQKVTPNLENAKRFIRKEQIKCTNRFEVLNKMYCRGRRARRARLVKLCI